LGANSAATFVAGKIVPCILFNPLAMQLAQRAHPELLLHGHILPMAAGPVVQAACGMSFALASSTHFAATAQGSNSSMRLLGASANTLPLHSFALPVYSYFDKRRPLRGREPDASKPSHVAAGLDVGKMSNCW